ncbi:MAG: hypothetical protein GC164_00900 [Phycisphaera sp.]|nr:hypothetical protein [Phycisphaera sp.]
MNMRGRALRSYNHLIMASLAGKLILAGADLVDPNFHQTVTLIIDHTDQGALGLVLNRPTKTTIASAWKQVSSGLCLIEGFVHQGGPCPGPVMLLHTLESCSQVEPCKGLHFTADREHVEWVLEHSDAPARMFVGYAGWGAGQLDAELEHESWVTTIGTPEFVFDDRPDLWMTLMDKVNPSQAAAVRKPRLFEVDPGLN